MLSLKSLQSSIQHKRKVTRKCHSTSIFIIECRRILHIDPERKTKSALGSMGKKTGKVHWRQISSLYLAMPFAYWKAPQFGGLPRGQFGGRFSLIVAKLLKQVGRAYEKEPMLRLAFRLPPQSYYQHCRHRRCRWVVLKNLSFATLDSDFGSTWMSQEVRING